MKTNIDWNKFKVFYYISKEGSFTAAAERLNISQPSLSRSIKDLEYQLGTRLFDRSTKGLILTKQGKYYLHAAERALEEFIKAETLTQIEWGELEGDINVVLPRSLVPGWFISHVSSFLKKNPKIHLNLREAADAISFSRHHADVVLTSFKKKEWEGGYELIYVFPLKLYASSSYLEKFGIPKGVKDLHSHKFIVFGFESSAPYPDINWPLRLGMSKGFHRTTAMSLNSLSEMAQAAIKGHGIVAIPEDYILLNNLPLIEVLPQIKKPRIPLYYLCSQQEQKSQKVKFLINYLKDKYSKRVHETVPLSKAAAHS